MHSLYLVRHAKSSWDDYSIEDFDRPLNDRGNRDAPEMAQRLVDRKVKIDSFISSPAKRAKKTCKYFCEAFNVKSDEIIFVDKLYLASAETFYSVVAGINNSTKNVAIFSHNPGITDFVNSLVKDVKIDNMPTCGIFAVQADISRWEDFRVAEKSLLFFDYPKSGTANG